MLKQYGSNSKQTPYYNNKLCFKNVILIQLRYLKAEQVVDGANDDIDGCCVPGLRPQVVLEICKCEWVWMSVRECLVEAFDINQVESPRTRERGERTHRDCGPHRAAAGSGRVCRWTGGPACSQSGLRSRSLPWARPGSPPCCTARKHPGPARCMRDTQNCWVGKNLANICVIYKQ